MSRACFVVGVGEGIGAAVARRFAAEGYSLGLVARTASTLEQLAAKLPTEAATAAADVADAAALTGAIDTLRAELGPPGILVYNAAAYTPTPARELTAQELRATLDVNVGGAATATRAVVGEMLQAGAGVLLFTGGGLALHPSAQASALSVGKAALRSYVSVLHDDLKADGVLAATVTVAGTVQPGTPFDPDVIAEVFWTMSRSPAAEAQAETVFSGR